MSQDDDEPQSRERNPRFPAETLKQSLERTERLFVGLGRGAAPSEAIVKAIGFNSLSGASRTSLAALSYYGLLSREGSNYKVSELALKIIRSVNPTDKVNAIWEACLAPKLFGEIQSQHQDCTEAVLIPILIHKGFSQDGAEKAARIFKDNLEFAGSLGYPPKESEQTHSFISPSVRVKFAGGQLMNPQSITANELPVPLGDNMVARVPFPMSEDDFALLIDTLNLWKKRIVKQSEQPAHSDLKPENTLRTADGIKVLLTHLQKG